MNTSHTTAKVALVTGALGGIGKGIVLALAQRGFDVVASDRRIDADAAATLREAMPSSSRLACVEGDLAALDDHPRFVADVFAAFGRIDVLVNNAGVSVLSRGDLLDVSPESYDLNFSVNTRGAFFLTQAVSRRMIADQPSGIESARSIIFVSSSNAAIAAPERGEYAMSKAAVAMMSKLYAVRLASHGIAVYEVRPGLIRTPMTQVAQDRFDTLLAEGFTPINRWGTPDDVGRAVATMASGDLPFTTGAAIQVDGGMHIHYY
ncbi:3-ketoacyl-ACP reductase [Paraburkholderia sp.]|uniref:3-ketoacyl-ACP reductase n=1 Tax=Paraburkholderia sp. TaxID=1926495 RepID=UPI00239F129F|nr:3-ketoacyl-ACP reductase [Paraburkholderia sp.]MDE1180780.1 3-ketoacyl-ACP reductase [Paraburkholderia sp.]